MFSVLLCGCANNMVSQAADTVAAEAVVQTKSTLSVTTSLSDNTVTSEDTTVVSETLTDNDLEEDTLSVSSETEDLSSQTEPIETAFESPKKSEVSADNTVAVNTINEKYAVTSGGYVFLNASYAPMIEIGGIKSPAENGGEYYRLDIDNKSIYSDDNNLLAKDTAGVTLRFITNAPDIQIEIDMRDVISGLENMTPRGAYGIDVYTGTGTDRVYCGKDLHNMTDLNHISENIQLNGTYEEVLINLPQYAGVSYVQIGIPSGYRIGKPTPRDRKPIAFYGSSITQGASASRPGLSYPNIVCRMLNCDCVNLGFSGSAMGEQSIAEYIGDLDISALVMDYDYNNTVEGLDKTHYNFYKTVRKSLPDIPILFMTRPVYTDSPDSDDLERISIIKATYDKAVEEGDENVYFISGDNFFPDEYRDLFTIDMVHPDDTGHYFMAKAAYKILAYALN